MPVIKPKAKIATSVPVMSSAAPSFERRTVCNQLHEADSFQSIARGGPIRTLILPGTA
jgi:hypothetical protein